MNDLEKLIQLTDEQSSVLNEIAAKIDEFRRLGGAILYDRYDYGIYAYNKSNLEDYTIVDDYERRNHYDESVWKDATDFIQPAPFYIDDIFLEDDYVLVMPKRNKNLF